jgi:hypothetical protein
MHMSGLRPTKHGMEMLIKLEPSINPGDVLADIIIKIYNNREQVPVSSETYMQRDRLILLNCRFSLGSSTNVHGIVHL